jgi:hypothetical protein
VVVILNEPPPELLLLLEDADPLLEEELLRPPLEEVDPLLPDEDELLLVAPEDDELPPLEDELLPLELELEVEPELELVMASLLLLLPPLQAAKVRHEIAASKLSSSVEKRMGSVLIQRATRRRDRYSLNKSSGKMSLWRDGIFGTPVTLCAHSQQHTPNLQCQHQLDTRCHVAQ